MVSHEDANLCRYLSELSLVILYKVGSSVRDEDYIGKWMNHRLQTRNLLLAMIRSGTIAAIVLTVEDLRYLSSRKSVFDRNCDSITRSM